MSIRFKFRSSPNFDAVDIGPREKISVGELRLKIYAHKNLKIAHHDFDLVFSDAFTGQELPDDGIQIPSGSSVIVKRVPAGMSRSPLVPMETCPAFPIKDSKPIKPATPQADEFDDFGADLCPTPGKTSPKFDLEVGKKKYWGNEKENVAGLSNLAAAPGFDHCGNKKNILQEKDDKQAKLERLVNADNLAMQCTNLPPELKCPICDTFLKEAVMIPCCQHSFCAKCIRRVLIENGRCPRCSSNKCKVDSLLPNLSLRQAIEHLLESEMLVAGSANAMHKYVPDLESGIQVQDTSGAVTAVEREVDFPQSSTATGKGSNQIFPEACYDLHKTHHISVGAGRDFRSTFPSHKMNQGGYTHHANIQRRADGFAGFHGESQPADIPLTHVHDEAQSNIKKTAGPWLDSEGGERNFPAPGCHRKVGRNCYACGSPDHLMRDCPVALDRPPMLQTGNGMFRGAMPGYGALYWNRNPMSSFRPFVNMYNSSVMMPFNGSVVPVTPFAVPRYMPSMYGGIPGTGGHSRMGCMGPPAGNRVERPPYHSEYQELECPESRGRLTNQKLAREQHSHDDDDSHGCHRYKKPARSNEYKSQKEKEPSFSYSGDSSNRRSQRKHQCDKFIDSDIHHYDERHTSYHSERSNSGKEDVSKRSEKCSEERWKRFQRESHLHHEQKRQCDNEFGLVHHTTQKDSKRRTEFEVGVSQKKYQRHLGCDFEPRPPCDQRRQYKERDSTRDSEHSRHIMKRSSENLCDDRLQMNSGSDEDGGDDFCYSKRTRIYI